MKGDLSPNSGAADVVPAGMYDHIGRPHDERLPVIIGEAGPNARYAYEEFFFGRIDNAHTRAAYRRDVDRFLNHVHRLGLALHQVTPKLVRSYLENLAPLNPAAPPLSAPTRKRVLAALRAFFDAAVILMGNLTRDPKLGTLPVSGTPVCEFGLAVNRRWKDAGGVDREEVLFVDCTAFGKQAKAIAEHLAKGRPVRVEGRLKLDRWEQEDGQMRSKISVTVEQFRFVGHKPGNDRSPAKRVGGRGRGGARIASDRAERALVSGRAGAGADVPF